MSPRLLALTLVPVFATVAQAQPGNYEPSAAPAYATPPPAAAPIAPPSAPAQRWSVGLSVGQVELAPEVDPDATAQFSVGEIALRYRGWQHLELELTLGGGTQRLDDGTEGEYAMATGTLAARYRFNPERRWNWWLLAGLGSTTVAPRDSSDADLELARRVHGTIGIGLEHRWTRFGIQIEGRALAIGASEGEKMYATDTGGMTTGLSGGSFTLGGSYYF